MEGGAGKPEPGVEADEKERKDADGSSSSPSVHSCCQHLDIGMDRI